MKDWTEKVDNLSTEQGTITASDFNSTYNEAKNVVKPIMSLDENDNKQLVKSIDILSKTVGYNDIGSANVIKLTRSAITEVIETYKDGMTLFFTTTNTNTGSTTLEVQNLGAKPTKHNGVDLPSSYIQPNRIFIASYNQAEDIFEVSDITSGASSSGLLSWLVADGVAPDDAVNRSQLDLKLDRASVLDVLDSVETDKPLSANQIRVLKGLIDNLNTKLISNTPTLDTYQKIIDYAKANRTLLSSSLAIADVTGLQTALDSKSALVHNHDALYYKKTQSDGAFQGKALKEGDLTQPFLVADAVNDSELINVSQFNDAVNDIIIDFDYINTADPLVTTNPTSLGATWLNTTSGEIFVCTGISTDDNVWRGTNGTIVHIPPQSQIVDIFGDASGLALYEFEGNANDTGGVHNATVGTGVTYANNGHINISSADLTGLHTKIDIDLGAFKVKAISFWYKMNGLSATEHQIVQHGSGGGVYYFKVITGTSTININGGTLKIDGVAKSDGDAFTADSAWHHYVFEVANNSRTQVRFGIDQASQGLSAKGWFDQVRLFNRTLTPAEITTLINET